MPGTVLDEEAIFKIAYQLPSPEARAEYLSRACGGDAALFNRVDLLLRLRDEQPSFMEQPASNNFRSHLEGSPGAQIGPYKLIEQIGEGGMGVVYLAQQMQPVMRRVALKIIKPGMDSQEVIKRFEAERQALALMDHPHIAKVLDVGATELGRPYFVMELVHGAPINRYCDDCHLTLRQRLELFVAVCQAIQHAHQKGIIHRDIKPSNILVTEYEDRPTPKVIDFGIAKATEQKLTERTVATSFGTLVGTLEYMSPEQAEVSALGVDTRSDIYSLGVLLYELLTGSTPVELARIRNAPYGEILKMIKEEEPPKPSTRLGATGATLASGSPRRHMEPARLAKLVRGDLDWIVMKCLEKDRARRYDTAIGLAHDIERYLRDEPVEACPPSAGYRLRKFVRRNRVPVVAASVVAVALVVGVIGAIWGMVRANAAQAVAEGETKQKEEALQSAKEKLRLSLYERARAGRFSQQMGQRVETLAALAEAARIHPDERLRDEAMAAMALPDIRRVVGWRSSAPANLSVAYGGHYRVYARMDDGKNISIRSIPEDREIQSIPSRPILGKNVFFSQDERFLLWLTEGDTLHVRRVADGKRVFLDGLEGCRAHAFSADGKLLCVGQKDSVHCFDLVTGRQVNTFRLPTQAHTFALHPTNGHLAVGYIRSRVSSVYDSQSGNLVAELPLGGNRAGQVVAWHPDGERVAIAGADARIEIWNVAAKRNVANLEGHLQNINAISFHPEGELLASHGFDGMLILWHPSTGRELMRLNTAASPRFSADGRWLGVVWNRDRADLLEVTPNREYRTLVSSNGAGRIGYYFADVSRDGRLLAVNTDDGARLWDVRSGREVAALPSLTFSVCFENETGEDGTLGPRALLTSGTDGVLRWPIRGDDSGEKNKLKIGPPQQLSPLSRAWFSRDTAGNPIAVANNGSASQILNLETGAVRQELGQHPQGEAQALSPDGKWVASSGWSTDRVCLWNAATGAKVHEWVAGVQTAVFFTPDSRALITSRGQEFCFWDLATFEPIRRVPRDNAPFPGRVAFSADGKLMALEMAPGVIHLQDVASERTVARLEDPQGDRSTWICFSPDGGELVVACQFAHAAHVWDLRAMRARLKEMNLDWDWPEFGPPVAAGPPLTIGVVSGSATK